MRLRNYDLCEHKYYEYLETISEMKEPKTAFLVATYESHQFPAHLWSPISHPVWNDFSNKSIVLRLLSFLVIKVSFSRIIAKISVKPCVLELDPHSEVVSGREGPTTCRVY